MLKIELVKNTPVFLVPSTAKASIQRISKLSTKH